jgi:hypothetical protein
VQHACVMCGHKHAPRTRQQHAGRLTSAPHRLHWPRSCNHLCSQQQTTCCIAPQQSYVTTLLHSCSLSCAAALPCRLTLDACLQCC